MRRGQTFASVKSQRGVIITAVLILIGIAMFGIALTLLSANRLKINVDKKNMDILAQVKAALISYAASSPHAADVKTTRPGDLPCPDRNNDGLDNDGPCAPGELGRIPWKTLGIPQPTDSSGETLWYAVSGNFRETNSNPAQINSDTVGTLTVFANDGVTALTTNAVAVLFAPGAAVAGQSRDAASVNIAGNYLDAANGQNNATVNGPFITAQQSNTFNDQVVYITTSDLLPAIEIQVATVLNGVLTSYRNLSTCLCYPWAVTFSTGGTTSMPGVNRGRLPAMAPGMALPEDWGTNGSVVPPVWFAANAWSSVIYYAIAKQNLDHQGASCTTCVATTLSINGTSGFSVVFFTPGAAVSGVTRPSNVVSDYLRDAQNSDDADDAYVTPTSTALNRNRLFTLTSAAANP